MDAREDVDDMNPNEEICQAMENDTMFCYAVLADNNENTIYSDLPGRFPVQSFRGQYYIFEAYVYIINVILLCCMKSRTDVCVVAAFKDIYDYLTTKNLKPQLHVIGNACSKAV